MKLTYLGPVIILYPAIIFEMIKSIKKNPPADTILSLIIKTENDEDIIEESLKELNVKLKKLKVNYEIIVVDNHSTDLTLTKIKKIQTKFPFIRILQLSRSYDLEIALTAGIDNAIGDYTILFNFYTDPTNAIEGILTELLRDYDLVIGKPVKEIIKKDLISSLFLRFVEKTSEHGFSYRQNFLTGFSRKAVNSIVKIKRKNRNFSYIGSLIGFNKTEIEYNPLKRFKKKVKEENFFELFSNVLNIIISNSFRPIRFLSLIGMFFSLLFLLYVLGVAASDFFLKTQFAPKGWITVSTVIALMFLILFLLLTIISEYLVRILSESRDEPLYYIADEIDKSTILDREESLNVV